MENTTQNMTKRHAPVLMALEKMMKLLEGSFARRFSDIEKGVPAENIRLLSRTLILSRAIYYMQTAIAMRVFTD